MTVREQQGELVAYAEASDTSLSGRAVWVEVAGTAVRVVLRYMPNAGCHGVESLGPMADFDSRLGPWCCISAWLD